MKHRVWLVLALFAVWLALLPAAALSGRSSHGPSSRESVHEVVTAVASSVEALPAPTVALRIAAAPFLARLPVALEPLLRSSHVWSRLEAPAPRDARRAIGRIQVRRAVPRLNDSEPPWSAAV